MDLLILGLDGATFDVIHPLSREGWMPNLGQLMNAGVSYPLRSTIPPISPVAWTSFMTGKDPARHGIFDFRTFDPHSYHEAFNNATQIHSDTLWQILSSHGKRVCVINVPMTYPPSAVNGMMVSGFDAPSPTAGIVYPPECCDRLFELIPDYDPMPQVGRGAGVGPYVSALKSGFQQRARLAEHLIQSDSWDMMMVQFSETDHLQHNLWHFLDQHSALRANDAQRATVLNCLEYLDMLVGRLLSEAQAATTIIMSDHGFTRRRGYIYPNTLLAQWGYLAPRSPLPTMLAKDAYTRYRSAILARTRRFVHRFMGDRPWLSGGVTRTRRRTFADHLRAQPLTAQLNCNWERTRALVALTPIYGLVYLNVRGRSPLGIVDPGQEYQDILNELADRFLGVRDPVNGEELFAAALPGEQVYPSSECTPPDLVLVPRAGFEVRRSLSSRFVKHLDSAGQGTHALDGILIASGAFVRDHRRDPPPHPQIVDLAPTMLHLLHLPVPDDMDGYVLTEVFDTPWPIEHISVADTDRQPMSLEYAYSGSEAADIQARLRGLGYLE